MQGSNDDATNELSLTIDRSVLTGLVEIDYYRREILTIPRIFGLSVVKYGDPVTQPYAAFETGNQIHTGIAPFHNDFYHTVRCAPLPQNCPDGDYRYIIWRKRERKSGAIVGSEGGTFAPYKIYGVGEANLPVPQQVWRPGSRDNAAYRIGIINLISGARSGMSSEVILANQVGYSIR
jgi:hypothetical protein